VQGREKGGKREKDTGWGKERKVQGREKGEKKMKVQGREKGGKREEGTV
jgi:hypothetical protein